MILADIYIHECFEAEHLQYIFFIINDKSEQKILHIGQCNGCRNSYSSCS